MKKIFLLSILLLIFNFTFADELRFIVQEDITLEDSNWNNCKFKKGNILTQRKDIVGIGISMPKPLEIEIGLYSPDYNENFFFPIRTITLEGSNKKIEKSISNDYWIPRYYYAQIENSNRTAIVLENESYWETKTIYSRDEELTWIDEFGIGKFYFGDFYFFYFGGYGYDDVDFLAHLKESSEKKIVYTVQNMYSHFFDYRKKSRYPHPEYLPLFKRQTPFKVIFAIDGDYMKMYIDEVSDKNLFQTLVRTSPAACEQIENWIKSKSDDLSKVTWPRHADGTCDYDTTVRLQSGKRYRASDNLRLRSSGSTAGKPVVTIGKGTQVKVLSIGAEQTIDGITSNWVQVEVQAGAKDRDGKAIAAGTTGWCFGGYLAER